MGLGTSGNRLKEARKALGLTLEAFGSRLGISKAAVSRWENEQNDLPEVNCIAIEHVYDISAEWLLKGEGSRFVQQPGRVQRLLEEQVTLRPMIDGAASCGPGGEIADPGPNAPTVPFSKDFLHQLLHETGGGGLEDVFVVECKGDSMRPIIRPGDLAVISTAIPGRLDPTHDGLYLVRTDPNSADARVKRVRIEDGRIWFISEARGFHPISVNVDGVPIQSLVLGRVCWIGRSMLKEESLEMNW